jgi:LysR family glycine cleavage system transcriptional activator
MPPRLPPLDSLRALDACVRHLNFTRAAEELGITQGAVSLRIRNLEREIGQSLFVRHGPQVRPTEAGIGLASDMADILARIRTAVDAVRDPEKRPQLVSTTPTFASFLTPFLAEYRGQAGGRPIRLDVTQSIRAIEPGLCDIAIRSGPGGWPGLAQECLLRLNRTPMLSPALARQIGRDHPTNLLRGPLITDRGWETWFRGIGVDPAGMTTGTTEYPTQDLLAQAAVAGEGVALLTPALFRPLLLSGALIQPFAHMLDDGMSYFVVYRAAEGRAAFIDWLIALCAQA